MPKLQDRVPKKLFRAPPPRELTERVLQACGFLGIGDLRWFSRDEIKLDGSEEWLAELESYYLPCKAQRFFYGRETIDVIPILRHCLSVLGYTLATSERLYKDKKQTLYQIQPVRGLLDLSGVSLEVCFE